MKKLLITGTKAIIFFVGWTVLAGLLPIPDFQNGAVWRFWAELIPFLCIVGFTLIFWLIEKRKVEMHIISKPFRAIPPNVNNIQNKQTSSCNPKL